MLLLVHPYPLVCGLRRLMGLNCIRYVSKACISLYFSGPFAAFDKKMPTKNEKSFSFFGYSCVDHKMDCLITRQRTNVTLDLSQKPGKCTIS